MKLYYAHNRKQRGGLSLQGSCHAGFSLIELAVVLVISALLLAGGLKILSTERQIRDRKAADAQLAEAIETLIGYALTHGRLPRPAISAINGQERAACSNDAQCTGLLPWEELSLVKTDPWGKILRYSVSPEYAGGDSGDILMQIDAGGTGSGATEAKMVMTTDPANRANLMRLMHAVPVVVISQGPRNWGETQDGVSLPANSNHHPDEDSNVSGIVDGSTAGTRFVSRPWSDTAHPRGEFDDQLRWLSPHILKARLVAAGRLP